MTVAATAAVVLMGTSARPAWSQDGDILQPGYILNVVTPDQGEEGERTVTIDENGEISLGFYGRVTVGGMRLDDAEREVQRALSGYFRSTAGIDVTLEQRQLLVRVSGLVEEPGWVSVPMQADPWLAIQAAGGPTEGADLSRIAVDRSGSEERVVDLRGYLTRERADALPALQSLDEIIVPAVTGLSAVAGDASVYLDTPQMNSSVVILGAVRAPGVYRRPQGLTALAALGLANGPQDDADLANVRLLTESGSRRVDLEHHIVGRNGREPGMLPHDGMAIIYVPARRPGQANPFTGGVSVIGAVTTPRFIEMSETMPLIQVIALAGGPNGQADMSDVRHMRVRRGYSVSSQYDLERYVEDGGELENVTVEPGDVIVMRRDSETTTGQDILRGVTAATIIGSAVYLSLNLADELGNDQ